MNYEELLAWFDEERYQEVIDYINKNIDGIEGNTDKAKLLALRGDCYTRLSNSKEASRDYKKAIKLHDTNDRYYYNAGCCYIKLNESNKAIEYFEKAIEINDKNDTYYYSLGFAYNKLNESNKAIKYFDKAIEINDTNDEYYYNAGICYMELNEYNKAIKYFEKAIEINDDNDDNDEYYYSIGTCYIELNEYNKAIEYFEKAIEINDNNDEYYYRAGTCYIKLNEYNKAIEYFDKAIEINDKNDTYYYSLGFAYDKLNEFNKAIKYFEKAIEINNNNDAYYYHTGICYIELNAYDKAIKYFKKAIENNNINDNYYYSAGICYIKLNESNKAIKYFEKAIEINNNNDNNAYYYYILASLYNNKENNDKSKENNDESIKNYKKSFNSNPIVLKENNIILYFIIKNLKENNITGEIEKNIFLLYFQIFLLKSFLDGSKNSEIKTVSQYTNINSIQKMFYNKKENEKVEDNNKLTFRMYNSIYMNDPQEGSIFTKILKEDDNLNIFIDKLYPKEQLKSSNVYLTSFSINNDDILPMWTNYGNKTNGCKIEIKTNYFDSMNSMNSINYVDIKDDEFKSLNHGLINTFNLFNVVYCEKVKVKDNKYSYILSENKEENKEKNKDENKEKNKDENKEKNVKEHIKEIITILKEINIKLLDNTVEVDQEKVILSITKDLLDQVRFLFKDSIWAYEEEVRVVSFQNTKENIKLADIDENTKVPKLYIDLNKEIPYNEVNVILGSNVVKPNEVYQYLNHVGVKKVTLSDMEYNN